MKKSLIFIFILIFANPLFAGEASVADLYLYMIVKQYQYEDHHDGKCDICGKQPWVDLQKVLLAV